MSKSKVPSTITPAKAERLMREGVIDNYAIVKGVAHVKQGMGKEVGETSWPAEAPKKK
jgi:hypothetical protein